MARKTEPTNTERRAINLAYLKLSSVAAYLIYFGEDGAESDDETASDLIFEIRKEHFTEMVSPDVMFLSFSYADKWQHLYDSMLEGI